MLVLCNPQDFPKNQTENWDTMISLIQVLKYLFSHLLPSVTWIQSQFFFSGALACDWQRSTNSGILWSCRDLIVDRVLCGAALGVFVC